MRPEDLIPFFNRKNVKNFNYIIHLDNLKSIFQYEILCRNLLEQYDLKNHDISKEQYQKTREKNFLNFFPDEDIHNYVPLYISTHTPMVKSLSTPYKKYYAIIKITNKILKDMKERRKINIKISNQNINQRRLDKLEIRNISEFKTYDELEDFIKWDIINKRKFSQDHRDKLFKAAEILVPDKINQRFITKICPKSKYKRDIKKKIRQVLDYKWFEKKKYLLDFSMGEFKAEKN